MVIETRRAATARRRATLRFPILTTAAALIAIGHAANAQVVLPADAKPSCTVAAVEFASWFESGGATLNGTVQPADSLTFPDEPNCPFFKWAEQMFLWLTSPAPANVRSSARVLDSPLFFDVSPLDANGQRTLIPVTPGARNLDARISQRGPHAAPVVFDKTGRMFPLVRLQAGPTARPLVRDRAGQTVEIARTQLAPNGAPVFLDKDGKAVDVPTTRRGSPVLRDRAGRLIELRTDRKIVVNGRTLFLDSAGDAVGVELGQADGSVLLTAGGKLVYYALSVNDVFAYFLTGQKSGAISATKFPTTPANLTDIQNFALTHAKTFPDAHALAVELKSAWVETDGVADPGKYVTITATVPSFDTSDPLHWVRNGTKQAQLALVGLHVVGSAKGHPEMIWATFEHVDNTRNAEYTYLDTSGAKATVPQDNGGTWLFSTTPPAATPNVSLNSASDADIVAASPPTPIGASDILRINPWGMPAVTINTAATSVNTDVISINSSVIGQLLDGDVRRNYLLTGATWTIGGVVGGHGTGTNQMANTTMETFFQPSNCFACHTGNASNALGGAGGSGLSHVYGPLKPLFP